MGTSAINLATGMPVLKANGKSRWPDYQCRCQAEERSSCNAVVRFAGVFSCAVCVCVRVGGLQYVSAHIELQTWPCLYLYVSYLSASKHMFYENSHSLLGGRARVGGCVGGWVDGWTGRWLLNSYTYLFTSLCVDVLASRL